ncbi:MAG TPA: VOC family protein [Dehalococcoidia bacterium]|jgi:catechol 2,3-dioxygenase-like lactoylglutathione lyase family enzyme|nr:VOC family protein [Dehalococcoidia bacterium]
MAIALDHTIVPSHDKEAGARFFARMFGLKYEGAWGHFAPVQVNDKLSMDFDNRDQFESHHYAFLVEDSEFDEILGRVQSEGVKYGSGPTTQDDMQINNRHMGRGFYFRDTDGHSWEVITHTYVK